MGTLEIEEDEDALSRPRVGRPVPKEAFTDQGRFGVDADARSLGRRAAARQQGWLYRELANIEQLIEVRDTVASAISDAIEDLRNNGSKADVVILPNGFIPEGLTDDPAFTWTSINTQELGRLGDISVTGVAPRDAEFVVVCDLSRSVRIREQKRPGDSIPMVLEVKPINAKRAAEMLDTGLAQVASHQTRDEAIAELQSLRVEVLADVDYYASGIHVNRAVRLISIRDPHERNGP